MKRTYVKRGILRLGGRKNNFLVRRLPTLKRVQLPNDCVTFAKCQRVGRHWLTPIRVWIAGTDVRKIGSSWQSWLDLSTTKPYT